MTNPIFLTIDTPTLERLIRDKQITLDEIHCNDSSAHTRVQAILLESLKSQLREQ